MFNTKSPVGNGVSAPVAASYEASSTMTVPLTSQNGLEATASSANLSAQYKYPNVSQDTVSEDTL